MNGERLKRWINFLLIEEKSGFESHIINTILFLFGVSCLIYTIPNILIADWQVTIVVFIMSIYSLLAYYQNRFNHKFNLPLFVFVLNISLSIIWFFYKGIYNYLPLAFLIVLSILILTTEKRLHFRLIALVVGNIIVLILLGDIYPGLFHQLYNSERLYKFDYEFTSVTLVLFLAICLSYVKRSFDNERIINKLQKEEILKKNNQLEEQKNLIAEASEKRTKFFINMAHETRTPLTLIKNHLELYINKYGSNDEINIMKTNVEKLIAGMINYLDTEKYEKGMLIYNHYQLFNLSYLLAEKHLIFEKYASRNNLKLWLKEEKNIMLQGDPMAIDRVINNLLENAVKYSPQGGNIEVNLSTDKSKVILSVKDQGIGIPEDMHGKIFDPFYQISRDKQNLQGLGMGLALVKNIMEELGGTISVESSEGKGSEFKLLGYLLPATKLYLCGHGISKRPNGV